MPQIKTYGNELWLNAVADNEKYAVSVNPEMVERFCRKLDEYGLNYYAYTTDDFGKIAFNKSDLNLIEQVTAQRIAERGGQCQLTLRDRSLSVTNMQTRV